LLRLRARNYKDISKDALLYCTVFKFYYKFVQKVFNRISKFRLNKKTIKMRGPIKKLTTRFILAVSTLAVSSSALGLQTMEFFINDAIRQANERAAMANRSAAQARVEASQARVEASQARVETSQAKAELAQFKGEATQGALSNNPGS
jgi:hypothetical protein